MKRQRVRNAEYRELLEQNDADDYDQRNIQLQNQRRKIRQENVLEAQIQPGDTLQAIALRYNCTISDLKRLNKIEKEIEIHARKTIKVPVNAHTILLHTTNFDELPTVHKSGQNSPNHPGDLNHSSKNNHSTTDTSLQLPNNILDEKLLVASVSLASSSSGIDRDKNGNNAHSSSVRDSYRTILAKESRATAHGDTDPNDEDDFNFTDPLITPLAESSALYTEDTLQSGPHAIRGAPRSEFSCSGSDCDISWICLLIFILALCFAIPLIYVIYIAEHPDQFHHKEAEPFVIG
ncbi:lysM and putative peptidoglycan-binding domain-containing protein 4 [Sitodiplosis mosellana]|uniref:lysM and putative peptidoglycan-binding domain-containing protein 4 n=1 Tax=Sitodiplosis mosellana TaxID=263140 RepID=UPI002444855A|nr:lysM and putative peptidoglycan-binding domain-containing protein 4 [Sitodiplosis mosellana]XP_055311043.1 lysM and putative peptidoglycan-binding domain-containing protein 4 [Sitodiplosis mosellana]XP_055311044.1 lysM and putative peptidoglycan-binding domain-containing protein 4 [Sitodiplosis mosellana]